MKFPILMAMWKCKDEIGDKALEARCASRVDKMKEVIREYQRTLDPHDFRPLVEDVLRIPDVRKLIIGGTDEEFISCADVSRLPKFASQILEGRTAKLVALLPPDERQGDVLSLATVWFKCGFCRSLVDGTGAPRHQYQTSRDCFTGEQVGLVFGIRTLSRDWAKNFRFTFSETASNIARGLILNCGEDPRRITLAEMNSKFHRFAFYEGDRPVVRNWRETVSFTGFVRVRLVTVN